MLSAMVLAAGLGARLRPLTATMPKPLVPVGDRAALAHLLERLSASGVARVVVNAHYEATAMASFVAGRPGVVLSTEPELLGTAGGLARAAGSLGAGDVLVWNADIVAGVDPAALVADHAAARSRDATLVVRRRGPGEGSVGLDSTGAVVRLRGDRVGSLAREASGADFLGIHVVGAGLRAALPDRGCLVGDVYIPAMQAGALLRAFVWDGPFFDIGTVPSYLDANLAWLADRGERFWIGADARIGQGIALERSLVGRGAIVRGPPGATLERCVVWPGASVSAPLADAVVIPGVIARVAPC